jgi:hypothetical protein
MVDLNNNVPDHETFLQNYQILLQKVRQRFKVKDHKYIEISKSKASRMLNGQFDIVTLIKMASFVDYDVTLFFCQRL